MMRTFAGRNVMQLATKSNTVIGVVATNAALTKVEATKVAQMAHDGLARCIRPAHTMLDGDTIFALSTGNKKSDVTTIGTFAAEVMAQAILRAVKMAAPAGGLPGLNVGADFMSAPTFVGKFIFICLSIHPSRSSSTRCSPHVITNAPQKIGQKPSKVRMIPKSLTNLSGQPKQKCVNEQSE